jgi:hypothetical protein
MNEPFAMIPHRLWKECMNGEQKPDRRHIFVYLALASFHSQEKGCAWPSVKTLATTIGCKEDDVRKSLKWLNAGGWIRKEINVGQSTKYFIYDWLNRPFQETPERVVKPPAADPSPKRGGSPKQGRGVLPQTGEGNYIKELDKEINPVPKRPGRASRKPKEEIVLAPSDIPFELQFASKELCTFWNTCKGGEKSGRALGAMFTSCMKILEHNLGGKEELLLQIEGGIEAAGRKGKLWESISYVNWWRFVGSRKQQSLQSKAIQYTL